MRKFPSWGWALIAVPIVGFVGYLVVQAFAKKEYALIVTHSGPGTIDISDGTYSYPVPSNITMIATPDSGYQANWNLNGIDVEKGVNTFSIYVNGVNTIAVSFVPIGGGPTQPTGIRAVGSIALQQNFGFWFGNALAPIDIAECNDVWNFGRCTPQIMTFKVHDAAFNGVPNILVDVYPEINPDGTTYNALMWFAPVPVNPTDVPNWVAYDANNPFHLISGNDGTVSFLVFNAYGRDDITQDGSGAELSRNTGLYATTLGIIWTHRAFPVYHGLGPPPAEWWSGTGGGGTISYNRLVHANIADTDKYTIQSVLVNYGVKWK